MKGVLAHWRYRTDASERSRTSTLPLRDRVLAARGIRGADAVSAHLEPKLTHLHDPSGIPDLDRAAERVLAACRANEPIVIYGDYDVDGVTGTAILWHMLKAIAPDARVRTYVPHRLNEGYGLNTEAIRELAAEGARLVVTVDCGITGHGPARAAADLGVEMIITDHHNPPDRMNGLPEAVAVVHPRRPDSAYPFRDLSGAGVAYKLAWRLATMHCGGDRASPGLRGLLVDLLAFASLGTIADVVPLLGENRVIARHGLVRCKHSRFVGLRALVAASGLAGEDIDSMAVGFRLGPRLNAAGRMGHAREANELFTTDDPTRASEIAEHLSKQNSARQDVERRILEQAEELALNNGMTGSLGRRAIVLAHPDWHAGVVGIVCSRLVERHHRPVILMNLRDGVAHGSGRSIEGFNLHEAIASCGEHTAKFGGHDMAAGLQVVEPKLRSFTRAFLDYADRTIDPDRLSRRLTVDCDALLGELDAETVASMELMQPYGAGNPDPTLRLTGVVVTDRPMPLGSSGKHLAVLTRDPACDRRVRMVGWNMGEHRERFRTGAKFDLVVRPRISRWQGAARVEAEILDFCDTA
ncbi:MAG: single-stranded-DNA-specific exonuclease RecJ [Phycisphaerales bacterium]